MFLLVTSAVSASAASIPGEILYPVKRAAEQVRLTLASSEGQVDLHLDFARQRLQELQAVGDRGEVTADLLTEISAETAMVLDKIPTLPQEKQRVDLESLTAFQDQHLKTLEIMAASAHGDAEAKVKAALADGTAKREQALGLLAGVGSDSSPTVNSASSPLPTVSTEETQPTKADSTTMPGVTDTADPHDSGIATDTPGAASQNPGTDSEHTPPGQVKKATPHVPPGQIKQESPHIPSPKPKKTPNK